MKKMISLVLAVMMLVGILAVPAMAEETKPVGSLSSLVMSEEEDQALGVSIRRPLLKLLGLRGVFIPEAEGILPDGPKPRRHYDSLNALLMALQSGEVGDIKLPYYTARYLCSTNTGLKIREEYYPEKATGVAEWALSILSDGYSFMMKEDNTELRDAFDTQIAAMKDDGTLQKLIDEHIIKAAESGKPVAVDFEQFEGDPIRIGVTGDLPPMDYVAADGSFAGFNTAVLAEIGKRLQKNIQLVQVENVGRALALSEGVVDVVFWTRALSEKMVDGRVANRGISDEELEKKRGERREALTEEEKVILDEGTRPDEETKAKMAFRDRPSNTIITRPYFSDITVRVRLK